MNDKERLEEIKNSYLEGLHRLFGASWVSMPKENFDWLIQQAERVEELEKTRVDWEIEARTQYAINKRLKKENKRYKQALEFYADEETYETKFATDTDEICDPFTLIELDEGKKARKALEEKGG